MNKNDIDAEKRNDLDNFDELLDQDILKLFTNNKKDNSNKKENVDENINISKESTNNSITPLVSSSSENNQSDSGKKDDAPKNKDFRFNIETVSEEDLNYYIEHQIGMDCTNLSIIEEKILWDKLEDIYKDTENINIFNLFEPVIYKVPKPAEEMYKEENTRNRENLNDDINEMKYKRKYKPYILPFDKSKAEVKQHYLDIEEKDTYNFFIMNIKIEKYFLLNHDLETG